MLARDRKSQTLDELGWGHDARCLPRIHDDGMMGPVCATSAGRPLVAFEGCTSMKRVTKRHTGNDLSPFLGGLRS